MGTLIQLTTISTLAACLQLNTIGIAVATRLASNSTSNSTAARSNPTASDTSLLAANYEKYEPEPNGKPKSDGTGTR